MITAHSSQARTAPGHRCSTGRSAPRSVSSGASIKSLCADRKVRYKCLSDSIIPRVLYETWNRDQSTPLIRHLSTFPLSLCSCPPFYFFSVPTVFFLQIISTISVCLSHAKYRLPSRLPHDRARKRPLASLLRRRSDASPVPDPSSAARRGLTNSRPIAAPLLPRINYTRAWKHETALAILFASSTSRGM